MAQLLIQRRSCLVYGLRGACIIRLNMTLLPLLDGGRRLWYIIIIVNLLFLPSTVVTFPYFIIAGPMRWCLGKH